MPPSVEARSRLGAQQASLVAALLDGAEPPPGFEAVNWRAASEALARKRSRAVARAWPTLAYALGSPYEPLFATYAAVTPLPREGGPLADGRAFASWLSDRGQLPEASRPWLLAVDLRYKRTSEGLVRRSSVAAKAALLHNPRRLVIALRLPWLGERWITLPLGRQPAASRL